jgi:uncharacterized membrane protein
MQPLTAIYALIGLLCASAAWGAWRDHAHPRRLGNAGFYGLLALLFVAGDALPPALVGAMVVGLALVAGVGGVGRGARALPADAEREASAAHHGNRLFVPAIAIPLLTVAAVFALKSVTRDGQPLLSAQHLTLVALAFACVVALVLACVLLRDTPRAALVQSRGLMEAIGWAATLPLVLATLGAVFAQAGVGELVARVATWLVPVDSRVACVLAFGLGMVVFTMIMGNAFAAFPVMMGGIGLPLLVGRHGAEPASLAAIGMLTGYCGTLLTPMAANYNIVPAALLELRDPHAVIRAQWATALPLMALNLVLMYLIAFRGA